MSYQKITLFGNVGRNPDVRTIGQGENVTKVASISLATSEKYKDRNGEEHENTEWFNLVFWRKQAEFVEKYVHSGDELFIEGKQRTRKYTTKDGEERSVQEIIVETVQKPRAQRTDSVQSQPSQMPVPPAQEAGPESPLDSDLPF